jgi:hypothetical protein
MGKPRQGTLKQKQHLQQARDARGTRGDTEKENTNPLPISYPPPSPKSAAVKYHRHRAHAAEAENAQLKQDLKNSARREKRHKKKISDLQNKVKDAEKELEDATAHGEA